MTEASAAQVTGSDVANATDALTPESTPALESTTLESTTDSSVPDATETPLARRFRIWRG